MNKQFWVKKIVGFIVCAIAMVAVLGYVVMLLWNNVLVAVIGGVSLITFWQALGLLILGKILFGGLHGGWGGHKGGHWKKEMKEKWEGMSSEERERIKQEWRNRCRVWGKNDGGPAAGAE